MYGRLNHLNVTCSYIQTLRCVGDISNLHQVPIQQWIASGVQFKFVGDNVNKKRNVRDLRADHQGKMLNMFSMLAVRSRVQSHPSPSSGSGLTLASMSPSAFLPTQDDIRKLKQNLVVLVGRILCKYIRSLANFSSLLPDHILHCYSNEMKQKSEVYVLDVLMKNEACHAEMLDIMTAMHSYLGADFPSSRRVFSGGDQLTCEREVGAQRHVICGNTPRERLQLLEPQVEDWHCLLCFLTVCY